MTIIVNTNNEIPSHSAAKLATQLRLEGAKTVEILTNSITVNIDIKTGNERYQNLVDTLATVEHFYS